MPNGIIMGGVAKLLSRTCGSTGFRVKNGHVCTILYSAL
jgi:hypothetical protein